MQAPTFFSSFTPGDKICTYTFLTYVPNNRQRATCYFSVNNFNIFLLRLQAMKKSDSLTLTCPETESASVCLDRQTALPFPIAKCLEPASPAAYHHLQSL